MWALNGNVGWIVPNQRLAIVTRGHRRTVTLRRDWQTVLASNPGKNVVLEHPCDGTYAVFVREKVMVITGQEDMPALVVSFSDEVPEMTSSVNRLMVLLTRDTKAVANTFRAGSALPRALHGASALFVAMALQDAQLCYAVIDTCGLQLSKQDVPWSAALLRRAPRVIALLYMLALNGLYKHDFTHYAAALYSRQYPESIAHVQYWCKRGYFGIATDVDCVAADEIKRGDPFGPSVALVKRYTVAIGRRPAVLAPLSTIEFAKVAFLCLYRRVPAELARKIATTALRGF